MVLNTEFNSTNRQNFRRDEIEGIRGQENRFDSVADIYFVKSGKHCGKRRKCWLPAFFHFPSMFSKGFFPCLLKLMTMWYRAKYYFNYIAAASTATHALLSKAGFQSYWLLSRIIKVNIIIRCEGRENCAATVIIT